MTTVLLDSHVAHWWTAQPESLSAAALAAIDAADERAVADVSWLELATMGQRRRVALKVPLETWLRRLDSVLRTVPLSRVIAWRAVTLPRQFPRDPFDRVIFATAVEQGWRLVTKDLAMRDFPQHPPVTLW